MDQAISRNPGRSDFEFLKQRYLGHLRLRNFSILTLRQQEQGLRFFIAFLESRGKQSVGSVMRDDFEQYKAHMMVYRNRAGRPMVMGTIAGRLFMALSWFRFLKKKGVISINPGLDVQVPKRENKLPSSVLSQEEIGLLFQQPDSKTLVGKRDRTMMDVLYSTGVRAAELLNIRLPDLDLVQRTVRVRKGKGNKDRLLPLTGAAVRSLARYMEVVRPHLAECIRPSGNNWRQKCRTGGNLLFLSSYGGAITQTWLDEVMRRYLLKAGITRRVSPVHAFRHAIATHLLNNGMDVRYVQGLLGHARIDSTQIYTQVQSRPLREAVDKHHPRLRREREFVPFQFGRRYRA